MLSIEQKTGRASRRFAFLVFWVALTSLASAVSAQVPPKPTRAAANARAAANPGNPCCDITNINAATGTVTARVNSTGQSFQFAVNDATLLRSLKIGQAVFANFKTNQVSLNGAQPCCQIASAGKPSGVGNTVAGQNLGNAANPVNPCCQITSVDAATGVVTAKTNSSGQTFQFTPTNRQSLQLLRVGQGVYANFSARQVSLDGNTPSGSIVSIGPVDASVARIGPVDAAKPIGPVDANKPIGPVDAAKPTGPVEAARPIGPVDGVRPIGPVDGATPGQPCCQITSVNTETGIATAKVNATGQSFQFKVMNQQSLQSLKPGQHVSFGNPTSSPSTNPKPMENLYWNGVDMGGVIGVYGGIYGDGSSSPSGPGPNPGGPSPGCTDCRNQAVVQLQACKAAAEQHYAQGSPQLSMALNACQKTYDTAVKQCGCDGSGSAGGGPSPCAACQNNALQQLTACVSRANQQFQQNKGSSTAAAQLESELKACNATYGQELKACPCGP